MYKQNVLVIGASSGIGLETSELLAENSDNFVICASRNIESNTPEQLKGKKNTFFKNLDVADESSVKDFFDFIEKQYKTLQVIINCAGFVEPKSLFETTLENWQRTLDINLTGTFNVTKYGAFIMKKTGGKLINIASTAGLSPRPGWSAYAAAKSGVINFSSAISEELKEYGIRVFVLCPGRTATPLRKILAPKEDPTSIMQPKAVADVIQTIMKDEMNVLEGQPIIIRDRF